MEEMVTTEVVASEEPVYILVTGSRAGVAYKEVDEALCRVWDYWGDRDAFVIVHGGARGADQLAALWCKRNGVRDEVHPAIWKVDDNTDPSAIRTRPDGSTYNVRAGFERNQRMLEAHEYVSIIAFPRGAARGTNDMIQRARQAGYPLETGTGIYIW